MIKRAKAKEAKVTVHRPGPALRGRLLRGSALTASLLAVALTAGVEPVHANPEGGTVVAGDATINPIDGGSLQIDQVSDRVVIDWTSFSIDEGETVDFNQPDAGAIALNRVTGFDTSYINGVLTADGYVFLVNPNGVIFGASAVVDVGGLVASTADITNDDFMAGNFNFSIASANEAAMVANYGSITVAEAGLAALVAPTVRNSGIISANLGTVALAGARTFTLDFYGDGLFSFDTGATVTEAPEDGGALVENTGVITASGGHIFITALGAEDIINNAINMDGIIEAHTVGLDQGTIVLTGGDAGQVTVAGTLDVSGDDAGESGGSISITGDNIAIDTSAVLAADANTVGDGGDIIMVADGVMTHEGAISAFGGSELGSGGFVEVSGREEVNVWGSVDLGAGGLLFVDPENETVDAGEAVSFSNTLAGDGDVMIVADNDVFVDNAIDGTGGTGSLTIVSGRSTEINATITLDGGNFTSNINTEPAGYLGMRAAGTATFTNNATIDTNGGNVAINSGTLSATSSNVVTGAIITDGGTIDINTDGFVTISTGTLDGGGGNISVTATGDITVGDGAGTAIDASLGGNVALDAGANIVDGAGLIDMSGGGTLTLAAGGAVGSNSAIDTSGTFTVQGSAGTGRWYVSNSGGALTVGDVTSTGANIDLFNNNTVLVTGSLQAATTVYVAGTGMTISGTVSGTTIDLDTDALDIQATLTATDIYIAPITGGVDISLNGASALDLTNTELGLLDASGTVFFGNTSGSTDEVAIGAGTDISGESFDLTLAGSGTLSFDDSATALTADVGQIIDITGSDISGGGTMTDIAFTGVGTGQLDFDAGGAAILDVSGNASLDGTATGAVTYVNAGDLTVEGLSGTAINVDVTGDTTVETGTIVAGGDLTLTSSGTITVGDGAGTAIDASGGVYDVTLDAGADIVDGGGIIDMAGGGTLTLDAQTSVGASGAAIETSGSFSLTGSNADGDFYVENSGGTLTVQDITVAGVGSIGNLGITNTDADIDVTGTVLADSDASFDAGTGAFSNSGAITANVGGGVTTGGDVTIIADAVAINNTITGRDILVAPDTAGTTIRLADGVATDFSLDATEIANLVVDAPSTGELTIGTTASGDILVGGGATADFSTSVNVVTLRGATLTFDDSATALQMGDGATLTLDLTGAINGGGTSTDIFHGGAGNGVLNIDAGGSVTLATDAELALAGTSTGDFTLANTGTLAVDELNAAAINLDATDDITIETGTIIAGGDVVVTSSGTITVGDGAGTAIDASGGVYDVTLDAGEDIVDGGGLIAMNGATLTMSATGDIGSTADAIVASGTSYIDFAAGGSIDFENTGNTTILTGTVMSGGDIDIDITGDLTVGNGAGTAVDASGGVYDVALSATGSIIDGGGSIDMAGGTLTLEAGGAVGASGAAIDTSGSYALTGAASNGDFYVASTSSATLTVQDITVAAAGTATGDLNLSNADGEIVISGTVTADGDISANAFTDISLLGTADVSALQNLALDANGTIGTAIGSMLSGVVTIILDAGGDISTSGTVDASAAGVAVTLLSGGTITDAGNTYVFTDGTLRADAVGDIDLTLSGTAGSTVTAALNAGGNVDFFLRDGGDLTIDEVTSGGGTTTGVTAADGYVDIDLEDGLLTINENISAANASGYDVNLTADDMAIASTVTASGDIYIDPYTNSRDIALNDATGTSLNLTNAELAFLSTVNTVQIGRAGAGDVYIGGSGSLDLTGTNWSTATFLTDAVLYMTNGVESQDLDNLFDANVVLTGNTLIDTVNGGTGGDVHVTGTIDGTTDGAESLTVTSGAANIDFDSAGGQTTDLGALALSGNNITITDFATIGSQTYTATGEVTFGSSYTTMGNSFSLTGGLTLADDVLVDTSIPAGTGAGITIDDVTNNGYILTLDAGNDGDIALDSWTNTGAFDGLGTLNITDSNNTTISGTASGDTLHVFDSTTEVSLLGDVDLATLLFDTGPYGVTITGSNVFLVDQVTFNNLGDVTLGDNSGDVFVFTGGVDAQNGGVLVSGNFSFSGTGLVATSLSLEGDTTLTTDATMLLGDVFGNGYTLNLDGETTGDITLATFQNTVGTGQLHLIDADEFLATGAVTAHTVDIDTAQTSVIFQGLVTANSFLVGVGTYFTSLIGGTDITNFVTFLNSGGVQIGDQAGDTSLFVNGLQSTASDTSLGGVVSSEGGAMTFQNVLLVADTSIQTNVNTLTAGNVLVNGWIDSASGTSRNLDIVGDGTSTTTILGNVGDTDPLGSLDIYALNINLHDVSTVGAQTYDTVTGAGLVTFNSTYQTQGADVDVDGAVLIGDHATVDTTWGGAYQTGGIRFGSTGQDISFGLPNGTLTLISGGLTTVRGTLAGALNEFNSLTIWARLGAVLNGGTLGNDLTIHAGAFDGDLVHTPNSHIVFNGITTIGDTTDLTATGDITFLGPEFNTYSLIVRVNGLASSTPFSPVNIEENFSVGGLTEGEGSMSIWGSIRGVDSGQAASFGQQLEEERRDDILFNDCIVEVGCLNFDPSAIVIPVFDPVIYLYEREGIDEELRYSDLPNTEIWYRLGGAPDIWDERLGTSDDDDEDDEDEVDGNGQSSQGGSGR